MKQFIACICVALCLRVGFGLYIDAIKSAAQAEADVLPPVARFVKVSVTNIGTVWKDKETGKEYLENRYHLIAL